VTVSLEIKKIAFRDRGEKNVKTCYMCICGLITGHTSGTYHLCDKKDRDNGKEEKIREKSKKGEIKILRKR